MPVCSVLFNEHRRSALRSLMPWASSNFIQVYYLKRRARGTEEEQRLLPNDGVCREGTWDSVHRTSHNHNHKMICLLWSCWFLLCFSAGASNLYDFFFSFYFFDWLCFESKSEIHKHAAKHGQLSFKNTSVEALFLIFSWLLIFSYVFSFHLREQQLG